MKRRQRACGKGRKKWSARRFETPSGDKNYSAEIYSACPSLTNPFTSLDWYIPSNGGFGSYANKCSTFFGSGVPINYAGSISYQYPRTGNAYWGLFLINQLLIALPSFFIWLGGLWYIFMNKEGRKHIVIGLIYVGIVSILLYFNGKGYYAAAIYPSLMAFGGIWFSKLVTGKWFGWLRWVAPVSMLAMTALIFAMVLPFMSPEKLAHFYQTIHAENSSVLSWEDHKQHPLPQDFADMLGWKEMATKTARIYHSLPDSVQQQTMVYGDNYGEAGALSFYRKALGLPEIYSDNASYIFWLPDQFTQKYFLFVCDNLPDADDAFFNHWGKREILDSVTQTYAREYRAKIILYSHPDDSVRIIAEQHMRQSRDQFNFK